MPETRHCPHTMQRDFVGSSCVILMRRQIVVAAPFKAFDDLRDQLTYPTVILLRLNQKAARR